MSGFTDNRVRDPVISLARQRGSILRRLRPIETMYATMHPQSPGEADTDARIRFLYRQLEGVEAKMAALTASSVAGLIEQMEALRDHISNDAPEHAALAEAVLYGLCRLGQQRGRR